MSQQLLPPAFSASLPLPLLEEEGHVQHHPQGGQKQECEHCQDESCEKNKGNGVLSQMISRSKAANLARINLLLAIENGDLPLVHYLVTRANPMSIRTQDAEGNTALHVSAKAGHVDLILYFVERGIPIEIVNTAGHTPLMLAISFGRIAACNALLKLGADANKKDNLGFSPIIHAAQFGSVFNFHHLVSNAPVDVNDVDNDGHSALCWACYNGHRELVEYMLSDHCPKVPHLSILDNMHRTPMHWAASQNAREVCSFLVTRKCKWCSSSEGSDAFGGDDGSQEHSGATHRGCVTGKQMLDVRDEEGRTPADCANAKGYTTLAQNLEYERGGVRATVVTPTPKKDDEKYYQFLSSFLPFVCIIFLGMPYLPHWALVIAVMGAVMIHVSGRVVNWSNKNKTLVPAGLLISTLLGMTWCLLQMYYSFMTNLIMLSMIWGFAYSYYVIAYADPGFIQPDDAFFKRVLDAVATGSEPPSEYCRNCKIVKPPRSKHCRDCNACIDRFDHHCYWISNCVGKKNVRQFYLLLVHFIFAVVIFLYMILMFLINEAPTNTSETHFLGAGLAFAYNTHPQLLWMSVYLVLILVPVIGLASFHTNLIAKDTTTYESMTKFRSTPGGAPQQFSLRRVVAFVQRGAVVFSSGNMSSGGVVSTTSLSNSHAHPHPHSHSHTADLNV